MRAFSDKDGKPFATLKIVLIEDISFGNLTEEIATVENMTLQELKDVLQGFYPSVTDESEIRVFHFTCMD